RPAARSRPPGGGARRRIRQRAGRVCVQPRRRRRHVRGRRRRRPRLRGRVGPGRVDEPPPGVLRLGAAALRASPGRVRRHLLRAERPVGGAASAPGWAARARAVRSRPPSAWPPTGWPHTASSRPVWASRRRHARAR
ncbi:unnamed protein product, partial [Prorocentrum cordatum]